jgi:hypothetical protein
MGILAESTPFDHGLCQGLVGKYAHDSNRLGQAETMHPPDTFTTGQQISAMRPPQ